MNDDDRAFDRAVQTLLEGGSDRTRAETIDAVLLAVRTTPQERDLRIPWRTAIMSNPMRLIAAIAISVVVGVAAFSVLRASPGVGGVGGISSPSPTGSLSSPAQSPSTRPTPTPFSIDTGTWPTYTSTRYGFSIGHPADWTVRPGYGTWSFPGDANRYPDSPAEHFANPGDSIEAAAWSVAVQPGTTVDTWLQAYGPAAEGTPFAALQGLTVPASMDGHAGSLVRFSADTQAFFLVNNRIYVVAIWQSEDWIPGGVSRLLEAYLSTMHLLPGGPAPSSPAQSPSTRPTPTPFSIDTGTWPTYTSTRYGFSIGHPADWTVRPGYGTWSFPGDANRYPDSPAEHFANPGDSIEAAAWSVAVQPGTTVDTWLQAYGPAAEGTPFAALQGLTVPASMDGHAGSLVRFSADTQAFFLVNNRIYVVAIWQSEDWIPGGVSRLLEAYLSTMHLLPGGPAPSSPAPS